MAFSTGLSGLNAASKDLDVIGNNVANAATVGFKQGQAQFADIYANSLFGARLMIPGTGIIPNNYMYLFDPHPGNALSLQPGKRITSGISAMIGLRDGNPYFAVGLPGAHRIPYLPPFQGGLGFISQVGEERGPAGLVLLVQGADVAAPALLPLAPVRVKARRGEAGIALSWIRRTRIDGDSWDLAEVPLGEESERYEVAILDGSAPVDGAIVNEPAWIYPAEGESLAFGAAQSEIAVSLRQRSATVGAGQEWRGRVAVA